MTSESIILIFPTPILKSSIKRDFTEAELAFCQLSAQKVGGNYGNLVSEDSAILNHPTMAGIKEICQSEIDNYITNILKPKYELKGYITQSWLTYTTQNQYMHSHNHANSFLSGVLYINADEASDKIMFQRQSSSFFEFEASSYDVMNSDNWWISTNTGDILLFPSRTTHCVPRLEEDKIRISLAFNVFVDGVFGKKDNLTELKLKNALA